MQRRPVRAGGRSGHDEQGLIVKVLNDSGRERKKVAWRGRVLSALVATRAFFSRSRVICTCLACACSRDCDGIEPLQSSVSVRDDRF